MKKFVFLYYAHDEADGSMAAWAAWFDSLGDRFIDSGNPLGAGRLVTPAGDVELPVDQYAITGYSLVSAENLDDAVRLAATCPNGAAVRVYEALPM